jgi:cytochrome bd ubiquinol oxidase subunit II
MSLADLWFVLFILIIAAYLVLDGFDLGVGILHPFVARTDGERRVVLNAIGPIWDGNEVWLVVGGGVLFAAFPIVYAALFSGFYGAMMLVLFCLILRTVAIEFRSKMGSAGWRAVWDYVFFGASLGLAVLLGVALGNIARGIPLNEAGEVEVNNIFDLLNPFALLVGLTSIAMVTMHGALYLNLKTEGMLQERVQRLVPITMAIFALLAAVTGAAVFLQQDPIADGYLANPWRFIFPIAAAVLFVGAWLRFRGGREAIALGLSGATIALVIIAVGAGLYPNLLVSTTDPAFNMTTTNASSADNTLAILLIVAIIGIPFVLTYTSGVYYIFRGKVHLSHDSY